ncbi:MAG: bifunctional methylenetetrahydrofolate dehydrogenase/methenyltetrahydrofolate cyclohydrolase FolD [Mailhella sp.]|nr:bifunctional methylenetetrahydrofolate dehydrogenase/methenyltetrahydrofolate cyclohydrolase FolD [Mailhella sp.]
MLLLNGKQVAESVRARIRRDITISLESGVRAPVLAVILVGNDPASQVYVRNKEKACAALGIDSRTYRLPPDTEAEELLGLIRALSTDDGVDGILLQLPLPGGRKSRPFLDAIAPEKDVDGLHPYNQGLLSSQRPGLRPCTPLGIMRIFDYYGIGLDGKRAVVVGRSELVGRPLAFMMAAKGTDATVTLCHSHTRDLAAVCREADILCVAVGHPGLITADMVKKDAVVIDVGINRTADGLCGDVDFAEVSKVVSAITPVPGGVGPMTITGLLSNTVAAWKNRFGI